MKPCSIQKESGFVKISEKPIQTASPTSTCCAADFPASLFRLLDTVEDSTIQEVPCSFEIARLTAAKRPAYLLLENVPGLLNHDGGRTFAAILHALDGLGYGLEWQVLNSKDFESPNPEKRVYLIGYLNKRCRGKVFPFTETAGTSLIQIRPGAQGRASLPRKG